LVKKNTDLQYIERGIRAISKINYPEHASNYLATTQNGMETTPWQQLKNNDGNLEPIFQKNESQNQSYTKYV